MEASTSQHYGSGDGQTPNNAAASDAPAMGSAAVPQEKSLAISLQHRHAFGLKADVRCNVHYAEENQIIYPTGHNTVMYHTEDKTQKFFSASENCSGITALAVSPSKRYLAIAERGVENTEYECASCVIYDLVTGKKRKTIGANGQDGTPDVDCKEYIWVAFSSENRLLLTQCGPSASQNSDHDWSLLCWAWDKSKVMACMSISTNHQPIREVSFHPDASWVTVVGDGVLKFFSMNDRQFQERWAHKKGQQNFTSHAWLYDESLVVGTDNGEILLFDNGGEFMEFKQILSCSPMIKSEDQANQMYREARQISVNDANASICSLAITSAEENLAITTSTGQLLSVLLPSSDLMKDHEMHPEPVVTSFHNGPITGMDVCIRKSLVATCGADKSVRVWNYIDRTCEMCRYFNEEAFSVAFHPSGFHIIVGFSDKLRLMNVLMEDLKPFKDIPIKGCREVRFSNGGEYFAAVNSNMIQVYRFYTCELIQTLRGHNNKVRSLSWTPDDSTLVSAGMDGAVYEYQIFPEGRRVSDYVSKGTQFSCVLVYTDPSSRENSMYSVGTDKMLKELCNSQLQNGLESDKTLGQIWLSNSAKFPLDGEYIEYAAHSLPATRLRVTYDDQHLISVGDDGSLFIFDVRKKDRLGAKRDKENALPPADEILVTKTFLEDKQSQQADINRRVEELTNNIDFQVRHRDAFLKERMVELED
eukprot:gene447-864_t